MTKEQLDHLEAVAKAATPGPWTVAEDLEGYVYAGDGETVAMDEREGVADVEHIATFDPPTALALIARVRELEAALDKALGYRQDDQAYCFKLVAEREQAQGRAKELGRRNAELNETVTKLAIEVVEKAALVRLQEIVLGEARGWAKRWKRLAKKWHERSLYSEFLGTRAKERALHAIAAAPDSATVADLRAMARDALG